MIIIIITTTTTTTLITITITTKFEDISIRNIVTDPCNSEDEFSGSFTES